MYLVPLLETQPVPDGLLKLCKDDVTHIFNQSRCSMLVGIVVRHKTNTTTMDDNKKMRKTSKDKSIKNKNKGE